MNQIKKMITRTVTYGFIGCVTSSLGSFVSSAQELNTAQSESRGYAFDAAEYLRSGDVNPRMIGWEIQRAGQFGREDLITSIIDSWTPVGCGNPLGEPIQTVAELARGYSIVIVNEAHMNPSHRIAVGDIAAALKPLGFSYYAAETFDADALRSFNGTPMIGHGAYVNEPMYGRLLRRLHRLDYEFVAYEAEIPDDFQGNRLEYREETQAENLIQRVLSKDPEAKVLVHVGWDHARETPSKFGISWFAARLKEKTGIDPLSVTQTLCQSEAEADIITDSEQTKDGSTALEGFDLAIGKAPIEFEFGRPIWRQHIGDIPTTIPAGFSAEGDPLLIEARSSDEPDAAVPFDRVMIFPDEPAPLLMLPPGTYRVEAFDRDGRVGNPEVVIVE